MSTLEKLKACEAFDDDIGGHARSAAGNDKPVTTNTD